jgi:hypothetical protein
MSEVEPEKKSLLPLSQSRYSDPLKTRERKGDGRLVAMPVHAAFALHPHRSSSVQECQSGSPKCVWQNQRLHRPQYLVATIMHGSSREKCSGRIPRSAYFSLCLEFLDR